MPAPPPPATPNSATGGYLPSVSSPDAAALYDTDFDKFLQTVIVGVSGLAGKFVRPRWQELPPVQPERNVSWCAVGVYQIDPDDNAVIQHFPDGDGHDRSLRHETLQVMVSCYGYDAMKLCAIIRDGLWIPQNREELQRAGVTLQSTESIISVPELVNDRWLNRADMTFRLRRIVTRQYTVLNLLSAGGTISADGGSFNGEANAIQSTPWSVTNEV